jgi:RTX calcium-binding nonapeptide repeat (4 copies)
VKRIILLLAVAALAVPMLGATAAGAEPRNDPHPWECDGPEDPFNVIVGSRHNDRLVGTDCNDSIFARAGNDVVRGRLGYDILRGQRGNDRLIDLSFLIGGRMNGGPGIDTCVVVDDTNIQLVSCEVIVEVG